MSETHSVDGASEGSEAPDEMVEVAAPAPVATRAGRSGPVLPVAVTAVMALVAGLVIGATVGGSADDRADTAALAAADDSGDGDHGDGDHDGGDHGDDDGHHGGGHDEDYLDEYDDLLGRDARETGLYQLLLDHHWHGPDELGDLSVEDRQLLTYQLETINQLYYEYPTVADAEDDFKRAGPFIPGMGIHYISRDSSETITIPQEVGNDEEDGEEVRVSLLFEGSDPDSELIGYMFLAVGANTEEPPPVFVGAEGLWHQHTQMCIVTDPETGELDFPFVADQDGITEEMCNEVGGQMHELGSHMLHVWALPGLESKLGLYSEIDPAYPCEDGTYHRTPYAELEPPYDTTCADGSMG